MPSGNGSWNMKGYAATVMTNSTGSTWKWGSVATLSTGQWSRGSVQTSNFEIVKAQGKLPENNFGYSEVGKTALLGMNRQKTHNYGGSWTEVRTTGVVGPMFNYEPPWGSATRTLIRANQSNAVKAKLAKKVLDSEVDLSVAAGEWRETSAMFGALAKQLSAAARALRKGTFFRDLKREKTISGHEAKEMAANAWLLANYGIFPLVKDVLGAAKALERGLLKEKFHVVKARELFEDTRVVQYGNLASGLTTVTWKYKCETSARVKYSTVNFEIATLASLGLLNPLSLMWELKKLSFVADWGIGIGNWLGQIGAYFGQDFESGSETVFERITGHASYTRSVPPPTEITHYGTCGYINVQVARAPYQSFPMALVPAFKDPVSSFTVTTSMALLQQMKK